MEAEDHSNLILTIVGGALSEFKIVFKFFICNFPGRIALVPCKMPSSRSIMAFLWLAESYLLWQLGQVAVHMMLVHSQISANNRCHQ